MNLKLYLDKALEAYKNGNAIIKQFLIDSYGAEHFITDIKDRVTSYEAACAILNIKPLSVKDFEFLGKDKATKKFSEHRITIGIEAINEGWKANFDNESQWKYYVYFLNKSNGFSFFVLHGSGTSCGADFYIENEEKANVIAKVFRDDFIAYFF